MKTLRLLVLLVLLFSLSGSAIAVSLERRPAAPDDTPDELTDPVTRYVIDSPRLYYQVDPGCSPIRAPQSPQATVTSYLFRTAVHGVEPRLMDQHSYDEFCPAMDTKDFFSNLAVDDTYVYWMSSERGGIARMDKEGLSFEEPELFRSRPVRQSELVIVGDYIYQLATGLLSDGLFRIHRTSGAVTPLVSSAAIGNSPSDLKTDGVYLFWRNFTGSNWELRRYRISDGAYTTNIATGTIGYYPVAGNVVYVGIGNEIRSYTHSTGTLSAPLYSNFNVAAINDIVADGSALYFIQLMSTSGYELRRLPFGTSTADIIFFTSAVSGDVMSQLRIDGSYLFFLHNEVLKRLRTNADLAPLTNLRISGIEVTQAIQDDSNSVPLIQGRRTVVRLFAESDGADVPGVTARLILVDDGGSIVDGPLAPINLARSASFLRVPADIDRDDINQSFTFFLPPAWTDNPTLRLRAELNPFHFPPEPNYTDNVLTTSTFSLSASERLEMEFILFEYDSGGVRYRPDYRGDYLQTVSWVRRAYPLASSPGSASDPSPGFRPSMSYQYEADLGGNVDGTDRHPECEDRINRMPGEEGYLDDPSLCAAWYVVCPAFDTIRAAEELPDDIFLYGMVADDAGFPRGWACGAGVMGPSGTNGFGWDTDGTYADWYAGHEIGHSQGRGHVAAGSDDPATPGVFELCGQSRSDLGYPYGDTMTAAAPIGPADGSQRGFDVGDTGLNALLTPRVYPSDTWNDMMSYCNNQWISDYTYEAIKARLESTSRAPERLAPSEDGFLQLSGVIYTDTMEATISQARVWASLTTPPAAPVPGDYRIRLLGSGGGVLASHDFTPTEGSEYTSVLNVSAFVPYMAGAARLQITHPGSGTVLWSQAVSANAPTVSSVALSGAPTPVTGSVTLGWSAADANGDPLSYDVLYSRDDGATWQVLQLGLVGTSAAIDSSELGGSGTARFKVIASDGVLQGEGVSPPYEVADKAPVITLLNPAPDSSYEYGQELLFSAEVFDYQDGSLDGASVEWRDQTGFLLGTGTEFAQDDLLTGENIITITATNSAGLESSETFSIFVSDALELPGDSLTVGPDQVGWHVGLDEVGPLSASLHVGNNGPGPLSVSVSEDADWLSVSHTAGDAPFLLTFSASASAVRPGQFKATVVTISAGGQTVAVPVSLAKGYLPVPGGLNDEIFLPAMNRSP